MYSVKYKNPKAHEDGIWCCAWGKNDETAQEYVMTGSLDNGLKIWKWQVDHLEFVRACEGHRLGVISVDINKQGNMAASSSLDSQIYIWDLETGRSLRTYDGNPADTWTVAFSPDSRFICTGSYAGCINMIGVDSAKKENVIELDGKFTYCLAYSPDGKRLAAGAINGVVSICDLETGQVQPMDGHAMPVRSVAFSSDGRLLASASDDRQAKVYDVRDGRVVAPRLTGHAGSVTSAAFCASETGGENCLVTASTDKTVRVWDLAARAERHAFHEHEDQVWSVRCSPDGGKMMSVSDDRSVIVYEAAK